ncbi:methyltransferase-like protein 7A [Ixodes scapularis]|nr:methyltransferase-like protein 7A [Ixodes scapularis]
MERVINAALNCLVYVCIICGILFLVPIRLSKRIQEALFARLFYPVAMLLLNARLGRLRRLTVGQLKELLSHDDTLRKQGALRVLEIGTGSGANLEHVERKLQYWTLDPNPEFGADLRAQLKRNPKVTMERWIQGCGEDMRGVPDGHFDAVLMMYVLCSATDPERVLAECKRVLAKGGRLLFAEHVAHHEGSWGLAVQRILDPLWSSLCCGCHVTRRTGDVLASAGFAHLQLNELLLPVATPLSRNVWGYAEVD